MPPRGRRRVVGVRGPGVEDVRVGEELDVADFKGHVQSEPGAGFLEDSQRFLLSSRQGRDYAGIGEAGKGLDVVWVPSFCRETKQVMSANYTLRTWG